MNIKVQCYSGYKLNERPLAFTLNGREYRVENILDQWYGEDYIYFKLWADDQNIYLLKYQETVDVWTLEAFQKFDKG